MDEAVEDLIDESALTAFLDYRLGLVKVARLDALVSDVASVERAAMFSGQTRDEELHTILSDRVDQVNKVHDLARLLRGHDRVDSGPDPAVVGAAADVFTDGWFTLQLPNTMLWRTDAPSAADATGVIASSSLSNGTVSYSGILKNQEGANPFAEQLWMTSWLTVAGFPASPTTGLLRYRFTVDTAMVAYVSGLSGQLLADVALSVTNDLDNTSQAMTQLGNWHDVGWPVNLPIPLPNGAHAAFPSASLPVSGTIPVAQGKRVGIGLAYFAIVSFANGFVDLDPSSSFRARPTKPSPFYDWDTGRIEYRFEPEWWPKSVTDKIDLTPPHFP